ncbi:hypothetical protein [Vibrio quintilis]|uniref:hypothetical protein n=1 Tax=Vibrio quintilis TaxID=1117707 RepID=UPI001160E722|nr:hypothetical protein [Vibrio quintilis]
MVISRSGFQSLRLLKSYMRLFLDEPQLNQLMEQLVNETTEKIKLVAERAVCPELSSIGIFDYRQLNLLNKYKVLFRYEKHTNQAFIVAFMRQNQSAAKLFADLTSLSS